MSWLRISRSRLRHGFSRKKNRGTFDVARLQPARRDIGITSARH
jgi:hypothetical protein